MTAASRGLFRIRLARAPLAVWIALVVFVQPTDAQLFERATVIENARIVTMAGPVIEKGSLLIRGGRIAAIGETVEVPMLSKRFDAAGKTITPGFIDPWSALGNLGGSQKVDATSSAWDNFDVYSDYDVTAALANGVTAIYLAPGSGSGISGMGLVVRLVLQEDGTIGEPMVDEVALAINLDSAKQSIARIKLFSGLRKKFQVALDYQDALELYEEELEEYLEKLEERRKKKEAESAESAESAEDESDADKKDDVEDSKEAVKDTDKDEDAEPAPEPDKPKEDPKPEPKPKPDEDQPNAFSTAIRALNKSNYEANGDEAKPAKTDDSNNDDDEEKDEDELEKPAKPKRDPESEVLLKALDKELPVRIRADRSSDILNAIELAEEFNFRLIIEGATEAHLLSAQLADAEVTVVLGPAVRGRAYASGPYRRHLAANGLSLTKAGVDWVVGSGASSSRAARYVGMNAQLATALGDSKLDWLKLVTVKAAKMLGVSNRMGMLTRGRSADFVIWNGDPSDPGSKVDRVYVAGKEAFVATGK